MKYVRLGLCLIAMPAIIVLLLLADNRSVKRSTLICWDYSSYENVDRRDKVVLPTNKGRIFREGSTYRRGSDYYVQAPGEKCSIIKTD